MRTSVAVRVLLVALVLCVSSASVADAEKARAHYEKGMALYQIDEYGKALDEFKAAHVEKPDPAFLYNIAQCHRYLGNVGEALTYYRRFLSLAPETPKRAEVERRIRELEKAAASPKPAPPPAPPPGPAPASVSPPPAATPPPSPPPQVAPSPPPVGSRPPPIEVPAPSPPSPAAPPAASPAAPAVTLPPAVEPAPAAATPALPAATIEAAPLPAADRPVYTRWWFWTGLVVVVGGAVGLAVALAGNKTEDNCFGREACGRLP